MLENINGQRMADILKGAILDAKTSKARRIVALDAIKKFERCTWRSVAMEEALNGTGLSLDGVNLRFDGNDEALLEAIEKAIEHYMEAVGCKGEVFDELLNTEEAAEYLGISVEMMHTYTSRKRSLRGRLVRSLLFTREELDEFRATMKPAGNPNFEKRSNQN